MGDSDSDALKGEVREFWNRQSCDTNAATSGKFSREYFEEIEAFRYRDQPFIHSFAQFTRHRGRRVVEIGFGAGTDFIQWLRAGAIASGIDLTPEALDNLRHRIEVYGLPMPERIQVGDAENLPFETASFDLGYSFGVLHHTPDTERALAELVRVIRPGGDFRVMLYNRYSIMVLKIWVRQALLRGQPWRDLRWAMWNHLESEGTKGYTRGELVKILAGLPLEDIEVRTEVTAPDYLAAAEMPWLNWLFRMAIRLTGSKPAWRPSDYYTVRGLTDRKIEPRPRIAFTGNPLGFFHCISAKKKSE